MGNVLSLPNKMDELAALENQWIYHECSLFMRTETWLTNNTLDANIDLQSFTAVRVDRDMKRKGGGLIIYTNNCWPCFCEDGGVLP